MNIRRFFQALLAAVTLAILGVVIYYAVIFDGPFPDHPALRGQNDLALHVAAFFALSLPLLLTGVSRRKLAGLVGLAGLIEIVQVFQPDRNASWSDLGGGVAGIALGAVVAIGLRGIASLVTRPKEQIDE